jgi:hypothetical protein
MTEWCTDRPMVFGFRQPITTACNRSKFFTIPDHDHSSALADKMLFLKLVQCLSNAGASHAGHQRDEIMGQWNFRSERASRCSIV